MLDLNKKMLVIKSRDVMRHNIVEEREWRLFNFIQQQ